jgi:SAM-dependent methyltransferase
MQHPIERLMRHHAAAVVDSSTERALGILRDEIPSDIFSLMQWSVGLGYFETRLSVWGLAGETCLDFGCGTGNWTLAASRLFGRVIGVEIHRARLRAATAIRDALGVNNVTLAIEWRPAQLSSVDCILLYNVLPYIANRIETIETLLPSLKPTGRLVVAFHEIGVCPYYFFSGMRSLRLSYVRRAFVGPKYFGAARLRGRARFESTHGWLRTADVMSFFTAHGFHATWTSWDAPPSSMLPLFPARYCGVPFFREIVFERRSRLSSRVDPQQVPGHGHIGSISHSGAC